LSLEAVAQPHQRDGQEKEPECDPKHDKVHAPIFGGWDLKVGFGIGALE
jgi:hypothetical protein